MPKQYLTNITLYFYHFYFDVSYLIMHSASKTLSGLGAERRNTFFKGTRSLKKKRFFKRTGIRRAFSLKEPVLLKENRHSDVIHLNIDRSKSSACNCNRSYRNHSYRNGLYRVRPYRNLFNWNFSKRTFIQSGSSLARLPQTNSSLVNLEGGLCNTPLYNYLGVGQSI